MNDGKHTSRAYELQLQEVRHKLFSMGSIVEAMLNQASTSFEKTDQAHANLVIEMDNKVDELECEIDDMCMKILATRQPLASDLRFITISLKMVTDLERMGDLIVSICKRICELDVQSPDVIKAHIMDYFVETRTMVGSVLDTLSSANAEKAEKLICEDDAMDKHYSIIFERIIESMKNDPNSIFSLTRIQSIAKYLERIADHAINIAEDVIFLVKGQDVRHQHSASEK